MRKHSRKNVSVCVFYTFGEAYDRVNREALVHVLRMYDIEGKLLGGIKNIYVDSLACVRIKWGERE